ncbi:hypothetical protein HOS13_gp25 [Caulobacter phage Lullwater]|uniref:Uncharacterized protein n=1 Tax=Caulobacter phage Lullwater TaxID=2024607 RepID=A0A291LB28_9CAUD|nr:hypothetical protein HOS13_gp25 [Caulobacter phage Lullwater]ATI16332.1 hypothetical protein Lull_025 [Caulobacter phage Lullwater]
MSYQQLASVLTNGVNALVNAGHNPDEALQRVIDETYMAEDMKADLYARITEAWGGTGLLWNRTTLLALMAADAQR